MARDIERVINVSKQKFQWVVTKVLHAFRHNILPTVLQLRQNEESNREVNGMMLKSSVVKSWFGGLAESGSSFVKVQ